MEFVNSIRNTEATKLPVRLMHPDDGHAKRNNPGSFHKRVYIMMLPS